MREYLRDTLVGDNEEIEIFIEVNEDENNLAEESNDLGPTRARIGKSTAKAFQNSF